MLGVLKYSTSYQNDEIYFIVKWNIKRAKTTIFIISLLDQQQMDHSKEVTTNQGQIIVYKAPQCPFFSSLPPPPPPLLNEFKDLYIRKGRRHHQSGMKHTSTEKGDDIRMNLNKHYQL